MKVVLLKKICYKIHPTTTVKSQSTAATVNYYNNKFTEPQNMASIINTTFTKYLSQVWVGDVMVLSLPRRSAIVGLYETQRMMKRMITSAVAVPINYAEKTADVVSMSFFKAYPLGSSAVCDFETINTTRIMKAIKEMAKCGFSYTLNATAEDFVVSMESGIPELLFILPPTCRRITAKGVSCNAEEFTYVNQPHTSDAYESVGKAMGTTFDVIGKILRDVCGFSCFTMTGASRVPLRTRLPTIDVERTPYAIKRNCIEGCMIRQAADAELKTHKRKINVLYTSDGPKVKKPAYDVSAGTDLPGPTEDTIIKPFTTVMYNTGFKIEVPEDHAMWITARSSATKRSLMITGIVDRGYTGHIFVQVYNGTAGDVTLAADVSVAQGIFVKMTAPQFTRVGETEDLYPYESFARGEGGFGSSDKKQ